MPGSQKLSLIVLAHNHAEYTQRLLDSVLDVADSGTEVVLVDNGSCDGTRDVLCDFESRRPLTRLVLVDSNLGYSAGNNLGAKAASGDILLFLNNDMLALPGCFDRYVDLLADPDVGIAGIKLVFPDQRIQHAGIDLRMFGHPVQRYWGLLNGQDGDSSSMEVCGITGACLGIRREVFLNASGFSQDYRLLYQDVDLCLKVAATGLRIVYDPQSVMVHYESVTAGGMKSPQTIENDWGVFVNRWNRFMSRASAVSRDRLRRCFGECGIVIYGMGRLGALIAEDLRRNGIAVAAFSDSNPEKWGSKLDMIPVIAPADIDNIPRSAVLIGTMFEAEVIESLRAQAVQAPIIPSSLGPDVMHDLLS